MSLRDQQQSYLQRNFMMILMFAVLGCVALFIAIYFINKTFSEVLPEGPPPTSFVEPHMVAHWNC